MPSMEIERGIEFLNNDPTAMGEVVWLLRTALGLYDAEAFKLMASIHTNG